MQSTNPQSVAVPGGGTGTATFNVTCSAPTPTTGVLTITTNTTGSVPASSYAVSATGPSFPDGDSEPIGANQTASFMVEAGTYTVTLSGLPANCTLNSANPQTVTVPAGGGATAAFTVSCM